MSLILDALRKSEHQRQRHAGPGLAVVPEGKPSQRPAAWLLALGGLLALNALVLAAVLLSGPRAPAPADAPPAAAATIASPPRPVVATPTPPVPVVLPSRPSRSEVRPLNTEVTPSSPAPSAAPSAAPAPAGTAAPEARAEPQRQAAATAAPPSQQQLTDDARLPRFADLVVLGQLNVPHMHIDIHVYSATPADRFVFINMRRYNEGQATQEGPRIERISRDGVVMEHQGQRFFLARD
jgi:general secretion pathway protein B